MFYPQTVNLKGLKIQLKIWKGWVLRIISPKRGKVLNQKIWLIITFFPSHNNRNKCNEMIALLDEQLMVVDYPTLVMVLESLELGQRIFHQTTLPHNWMVSVQSMLAKLGGIIGLRKSKTWICIGTWLHA